MADVTSTFAAKDVGFTSTVNRMQRSLAGFQNGIGAFAVKAAGLVTAFVGVQQSFAAFNKALSMGGQLDDLSKTTGASAGELLLLQKAFELAGSSADAVGPAIARLNRFMVEAKSGGTAQIETMNKLGLSYEQLKSLTPTDQMRLLAKSIMALPTPAERTAAAMDIFGRSGATLIPLFANFSGELDKAQGYLGSLPGLLDESAGAMADMEDDIGALGDKFNQFVAGLIAGAAGADNFASALAKIDTAGIGAGLGEQLRVAFDAPLETAKAIGYTLLTGAKEAGNALINAAMFAGEAWVNTVSASKYIAGLGKRLEGAVLVAGYGFIRVMQEGIERIYKLIAQLPGPFGEAARQDLQDIEGWQSRLNARIKEGQDALAEGARLIQGSIDDAVNSTEILSKDWLGVEQSAADAARHLLEAQKVSDEIRANSEKTAENFGRGSAALRQALNEVRGFDLTPKEGPEQSPDWTRSTQPPPTSTSTPDAASNTGGSTFTTKPTTALDRLRAAAETDPNARAELMRLQDREARDMARADQMRSLGRFGSAARAQMAAETRAEASASREMQKQFMQSRFGARNVGDAFRNLGQEAFSAGMSLTEVMRRMEIEQQPGESQAEAFQRFVEEQGKTEAQRKEEAARGGESSGAGQSPADPMGEVIGKLEQIIQEITDRLPQNALAA
jgi:hypothetical protein